MLLLFTLFAVKHLVVDFPLQIPYMYLNKGTYGHLGGLAHAGLHGIATFLILFFISPPLWMLAISLGLADFILHYHIDWAKMNINKYYNWQPATSEYFWWLLGLDQFLHYLTYIGIILLWTT